MSAAEDADGEGVAGCEVAEGSADVTGSAANVAESAANVAESPAVPPDSRPGPVAGAGPGWVPASATVCTAGCISSLAGLATFRR